MKLFVDSNIYLDFYHFSSDDLDELKKLVDLIEKGEIKLIVTKQVVDEVRRNRDSKVSDAYKKFREGKIQLSIPQICKTYSEYRHLKKIIKKLNDTHSDLDEKLSKDIQNRSLKADKIIGKLFETSEIIDTTGFIEKAEVRYQLGNPPGKGGSYGDAVNWEALLSSVKESEDLFFISDDKDYKSPLNKEAFDSFLLDEWKNLKKSELFFYTRLSDFFNEHHKDIKLIVEEEKNELINELFHSPNFATTHTLINRLSKYESFTDEQTRQLVNAAVFNSQVKCILNDEDVSSFYSTVIKSKEKILDEKDSSFIKRKLSEKEEEDIPF